MPLVLIAIQIILLLSLLPWISLAFWFANFLNDALQATPLDDLIVLKIVSHLLVLLYPLFVLYSIGASWVLWKKKSSKSIVLLNAVLPILLLLLGLALFLLEYTISSFYHSF